MASTNIAILTINRTLSGTVAQFGPVTAAGAPATAAGNAVGFAQVGGVSTDVVPVVALGTSKAVAGAAITAGALVEVHSTVAQVVTRYAGVSIGRALTAAAAAGDEIEVLIIPN
jgi:hypothetical protein